MESLRDGKPDSDASTELSGYLNVPSWWLLVTATNDPQHEPRIVNILGKKFLQEAVFVQEILSKIHLTYRYGFDPIPRALDGPSPLSFLPSLMLNKATVLNSIKNLSTAVDGENFTTDVGWGCMIRTSQSLLANSYLHLISPSSQATREVIEMFDDKADAPYSIHNMVTAASTLPLKVKPGEWFGPSAASLSLMRLNEKVGVSGVSGIPNLRIILGENGDLYDDVIRDEFSSPTTPGGILILLPVRLGIDKINSYYKHSLFDLMSLSQCTGIAGGKPSSSYYFVGFSDSDMLYLNPHTPQPHLAQLVEASYHTREYLKLAFDSLDPSMLIGITFCSQQDYDDFKVHCLESDNKIVHFHQNKTKSPLDLSYDDLLQGPDVISNHDLQDDFVCISAQEPVGNLVAEGFIDITIESSKSPPVTQGNLDLELSTEYPTTNTSFHLVDEPCDA